MSVIIGVCVVHIPLNGGMFVEAYHTTEFGENFLSVGKLAKLSLILFDMSTYQHSF